MPDLVDTVRAAWHDLARRSLLCPPGWCGIVGIAGETISSAPDRTREQHLHDALARLPAAQHTDPTAVGRHLDVADVLGPATLSYLARPGPELRALREPRAPQAPGNPDPARRPVPTTADDPAVQRLLAGCPPQDVAEAAVADLTSPLFLVHDETGPAALAGYQRWPGGIAHLSVLTAPPARGRGWARCAAAAATEHALARGLLAQWRARPAASRRVAAALGFTVLGSQLSLDVRPSPVLTDGVVTLRCLRPEDAADHLAGQDPEQVRWLNGGRTSSADRVAEWIGQNAAQWRSGGPRLHLGVRDAGTGALAGGVEADLALLPGAPQVVNLSYAVFPAWRGRAFAARAVALLEQWLARNTPARTTVARIEPGNSPSHAVALAAGFTRTGPAPQPTGRHVRYEHALPARGRPGPTPSGNDPRTGPGCSPRGGGTV